MFDLIYAAWDSFSLWSAEQPIFLQAAIGVGLLWVVLKLVSYIFKILIFIGKSLFSSRKDYVSRPMPRHQMNATQTSVIEEDKARPYFFR